MKEATKRATSAALAHMLAVTAMLVIASVLFYSGSQRQSLTVHENLATQVTFSKYGTREGRSASSSSLRAQRSNPRFNKQKARLLPP